MACSDTPNGDPTSFIDTVTAIIGQTSAATNPIREKHRKISAAEMIYQTGCLISDCPKSVDFRRFGLLESAP